MSFRKNIFLLSFDFPFLLFAFFPDDVVNIISFQFISFLFALLIIILSSNVLFLSSLFPVLSTFLCSTFIHQFKCFILVRIIGSIFVFITLSFLCFLRIYCLQFSQPFWCIFMFLSFFIHIFSFFSIVSELSHFF